MSNETKDRTNISSQRSEVCYKLSKENIIRLALESGFEISTEYGQASDKLMPATNTRTLLIFVKSITDALEQINL